MKTLIDNLKEKFPHEIFQPSRDFSLPNQPVQQREFPIVPKKEFRNIAEFYYELNNFILNTNSDILIDNYGREVLDLLTDIYKILCEKLGKPVRPSLEDLIERLSYIIFEGNHYDQNHIISQIKEEIREEIHNLSLNNYDKKSSLHFFRNAAKNLCDFLPLMEMDIFDRDILEKFLNFLTNKCVPLYTFASFLNNPLFNIDQEFVENNPDNDCIFESEKHNSLNSEVQPCDTLGILGARSPLMATYKTSLVPPVSLKDEFTELIYQRESLLAATKGKKGLQCFLKGKVQSMPVDLKQKIMNNITHYQSYSRIELKEVLKDNQDQIDYFLRKEPHYRRRSLNNKDFPKFKDKSHPNVQEISLSDYKYLSALGVKQLASFMEDYTQNSVERLPLNFDKIIMQGLNNAKKRNNTKYTWETLKKNSEKAISEALEEKGNYAGTAQKLIGGAYKAKEQLEYKLEDLRALLFPESGITGFEPVSQIIAFNYSVPRHLMNYLRAKWKITDANWVRNTIVGWRRKIDVFLPNFMQIEIQNKWMENLRNDILNVCNITKEELEVINKLQKKRVLHIFCDKTGPSLSPFLDPDEAVIAARLRNRLPFHLLAPYKMFISDLSGYFQKALSSLNAEISQKLIQMNRNSSSYHNTEVFSNKLSYLNTLDTKNLIAKYLPYSLPGPRFAKALTKIIQSKNVYRRLYSVMRSVMSSAFALKHPDALVQLKRAFIPENALTLPFRSKKRKKHYLPIELVYPKYVILRKEEPNNERFLSYNSDDPLKVTVSSLFKEGKPIWLGIPIFNSEVLEVGKQTGKLKTLGFLWNQTFPSKKIRFALNHGAIVRNMRVLPPDGPSRKVIIDVVLSSSDPAAFKHGTSFLNVFNKKCNLSIPKGTYFGTDLNRICRQLLGVAVDGHEIPLWKCTLTDRLEKIQYSIDHLTHKEIPLLQRKKQKLQKKSKSSNRIDPQITLLHKRITHLRKEAHFLGIMNLIYLIKKSEAKYVQWDGVEGITHRGVSGSLAKAITGMPKSESFYKIFVEWLKDAYPLRNSPDVIVLPPPRSMVCPDAYKLTGTQSKTAQPSPLGYDFIICNGKTWSRHGASASIGSLMLKNYILNNSAG